MVIYHATDDGDEVEASYNGEIIYRGLCKDFNPPEPKRPGLNIYYVNKPGGLTSDHQTVNIGGKN